MMTSEQEKSENNADVSGDNAPRRAWTEPIITRIDIKRTMLGSGSNADTTQPTG